MKEGKIYKLGSKDGFAIVKLKEILTYPSSGMPDDYLFEYQPGSIKPIIHPDAEQLFGSKDVFPIPAGLIPMIKESYGLEEVL
jgi:hypothetical protein